MADKLIVDEHRHGYRVVWQLDDDEFGIGAALGETAPGTPFRDQSPPTDPNELAMFLCERAAEACSPDGRDTYGFWWESKTKADAARKAANAAMKHRSLEDWEQKALAAGWTPPKGRL